MIICSKSYTFKLYQQCICVWAIAVSGLAFAAEESTAVPGNIRSGQIEKQFEREKLPRADQPKQPPQIPSINVDTAHKGAEFTVNIIRVEGATVVSAEELDSIKAQYVGKKCTLGDMQNVAQQVTILYRNKGYFLSQAIVPQQKFDNGTVTISVIEGFVDNIELRGDGASGSGLATRILNHVKEEKPLNIVTLQRQILLLNDLEGVNAKATLVPGKEQGSASLIVEMTRRYFGGSLALDNRGSKALGPARATLEVHQSGLFGGYENIQLDLVSTGANKEMNYGSLVYTQPLGSNGLNLEIKTSKVRSEPTITENVNLDSLLTDSTSFGTTIKYPIHRLRNQNLSIRGSIDAYNSNTDIPGFNLTQDRVRTARVGVSLDQYDIFSGVNLLDIEYSHGIDGLGAKNLSEAAIPSSNANANNHFQKYTVYLARLQSIAEHWSMLSAINGQYAVDNLFTSEQFGFGGALFGKAYDNSELIGDSGAAFKIELRYLSGGNQVLTSYEPYAFYDVGYTENRTKEPSSEGRASAASTGLGVRFNLFKSWSGYIEAAKPLTRDTNNGQDRNPRGFAALTFNF